MAVWHRRDSIKELKEKDIIIDNLGQEVAKLKLEIIQLKGGIE